MHRHPILAFAAASVGLVLSASCGCGEPVEYADFRTEKEVFVQKHLPEVQVVLSDLEREIDQHQARLSERAAKLSAGGRIPEEDAAYRRWSDLLDDMTRDRNELAGLADDVYYKHDELRLAGNAGQKEQEALVELMDDAREQAATARERLAKYRQKLSGDSTVEVAASVPTGADTSPAEVAFSESAEDSGPAYRDASFGERVSPKEVPATRELVGAPADESPRDWHDASGSFGVTAVLRGVSEPGTSQTQVWLRRTADGGTIAVAFEALSEADRRYIEERLGL